MTTRQLSTTLLQWLRQEKHKTIPWNWLILQHLLQYKTIKKLAIHCVTLIFVLWSHWFQYIVSSVILYAECNMSYRFYTRVLSHYLLPLRDVSQGSLTKLTKIVLPFIAVRTCNRSQIYLMCHQFRFPLS